MFYEDTSKDKEMFDFTNYSPKSKFYNSNALLLGKIVDAVAGLPIKEFVLKPKMYFFPVDGSSKHSETCE